ncbi:MAG: hypothetical protein UR94_C0046G0010 [Parcubacteria group bacterium GW2011_GWA2_36_10]|nr:MAG: hypothetical protein UR94_C0046G0010 [Parcubacteria group bacterium GW2011_GWA2_36_10]
MIIPYLNYILSKNIYFKHKLAITHHKTIPNIVVWFGAMHELETYVLHIFRYFKYIQK